MTLPQMPPSRLLLRHRLVLALLYLFLVMEVFAGVLSSSYDASRSNLACCRA